MTTLVMFMFPLMVAAIQTCCGRMVRRYSTHQVTSHLLWQTLTAFIVLARRVLSAIFGKTVSCSITPPTVKGLPASTLPSRSAPTAKLARCPISKASRRVRPTGPAGQWKTMTITTEDIGPIGTEVERTPEITLISLRATTTLGIVMDRKMNRRKVGSPVLASPSRKVALSR